jgi:PiT family inorganic phosphate transporter
MTLTLLFAFILIALLFEFINGFHDTANSIATVVATKVLTPTQAVMMAACMELIGALSGTAVAKTISSGIVDTQLVHMGPDVLICALVGGIAWNLMTWWLGLPSSSSHALIGGLCGAALARAFGDWNVLIWSQPATPWYTGKGLLWKIVIPMVSSPIIGFMMGFALMGLLMALISWLNARGGMLQRATRPRWINAMFGKAQLLSSAYMGFAHGLNDAQKTMGLITLGLVAAAGSGALDSLPDLLAFLRPDPDSHGEIATWTKIVCAVVMALGTATGGWRIIKTLGHKLVKLHPIHGFAAETSSATVLSLAAHFGMPVSTTHSISTAIMGVGTAKSTRALRWTVVERIVWAWLLTIPSTALVGFALVRVSQWMGWIV